MNKINSIYLLVLLCVSLFSLSSCKSKNQQEYSFNTYVTIPAGLNTIYHHYFVSTPIVGIPVGDWVEAQPSYIRAVVVEGETNADFILDAYLLTHETSGNLQREIGYWERNPITNNRTIQLFPSIINLLEDVQEDIFNVELKLRFRSIPFTETRIRVEFGVLLTAAE